MNNIMNNKESSIIKEETKKFLKNGNFIKRLPYSKTEESDVKKVFKNWYQIKCRRFPFGQYKSNVWNHEWTKQFKNYEKSEEWNESNHLTSNRKYWEEEMIPLYMMENPECKDSRLSDLNNISMKYN